MPAVVVAGALAAGGAVAGAAISSSASKKAANAATNAAAQNNALEREIYNQNLANETPFLNRGNAAGENINALLGLGGGNGSVSPEAAGKAFNAFTGSDGYQFRLGEGLKAANTGYAARGLLQSGAAMKGLNNYAQGQASDEFGRYLGYLNNQQQTGVAGANALAGAGSAFVNGVSANNNSAASAVGNAALANAANINAGIGNALSAYGTYQGLRSSYGQPASKPTWGEPGHEPVPGSWVPRAYGPGM